MASARQIILYLFHLGSLVLVSCRANAAFHPPRLGKGGRGLGHDELAALGRGPNPGETIFNVLQYGATLGIKKESTEVKLST